MLAQLDGAELERARTWNMDRIFAERSPDVLSTLGVLAEQNVPQVLAPGAEARPSSGELAGAPAIQRFEVTPALDGAHALALDMKLELSAAGARHSLRKAGVFSRAQLSVWDTKLETAAGERIVLLIQPVLIEGPEDLQQLLERRANSPPARR